MFFTPLVRAFSHIAWEPVKEQGPLHRKVPYHAYPSNQLQHIWNAASCYWASPQYDVSDACIRADYLWTSFITMKGKLFSICICFLLPHDAKRLSDFDVPLSKCPGCLSLSLSLAYTTVSVCCHSYNACRKCICPLRCCPLSPSSLPPP